MEYLQKIAEVSYLTAENAFRYRRIMRIFYKETTKLHIHLYKEDVMNLIKEYPGFEDYTLEQLQGDLQALAEWKNLIPTQDSRHVYSIADYKNKQYRYSMSAYAKEIEALTVKLENMLVERGGLSANLFSRIIVSLEKADELQVASLREVNEWWRDLQADFERLCKNHEDYIHEFYSGNAEKLLKSVEFIVHKDLLIKYLNEFIKDLQKYSVRIEYLLEQKAQLIEESILPLVFKSELEIPQLGMQQIDLKKQTKERISARWMNLKRWFLAADGGLSESSKVLDATNEIIRRIIQNAALIIQLQGWGANRKDDYYRYMRMFADCANVDEAHKLCAYVFGVQNIRHYRVNCSQASDSTNVSVYEDNVSEYVLKPHTRTYKARAEHQGFADKTMEK